jgi:hypothetical protein
LFVVTVKGSRETAGAAETGCSVLDDVVVVVVVVVVVSGVAGCCARSDAARARATKPDNSRRWGTFLAGIIFI